MSTAYLYPSVLYAIPPGKPYTSLEKLYFPFQISVWCCIFTLIVNGAVVINILKLVPKSGRDLLIGKSNDMPLFNMLSIGLGGGITFNHIPVKSFARALLAIWLISTLVLRNAYQGKLFDNLRSNQRMSPMFDIEELYESNLQLYLFPSYYVLLSDTHPQHKHR